MNNQKQNITLAILLGNIFIAFLGIGLVIPVLPTIMNELSVNGTIAGYLVAAFALTQLIVSPVSGKWVDQYGRKRMMVFGLFIFGLSELLFGLGQSVTALFISRMLGGMSAAFIMPAVTAFIADITTIEKRPKALGYMSAAISTGFIIGPGIGGFLAEIGTRVPFFAAAVLGVLAAILSFIFLKEPEKVKGSITERQEKKGFRHIFHPLYFIAFVVIFVSAVGLSSFESLFSLFVDHKFQFTPKDIAIAITGGAIVGAVAQVLAFDKLTDKLGEIMLIRYCLILSAVLTLAMTVVQSYFSILLTTFVVFVGFDLIRPAITTYLSKIAGNEQGFAGGMNSMFTSLGNICGPIIGGLLFDINLNFPLYFAAGILLLGLAITVFWKQPKQMKQYETFKPNI